jgi:hypothetical protein
MTRECDERMWNLAYRLARSGEHRNYQAIEWELRAFGYPQARQLLYHERVREGLDGICAEAQQGCLEVSRERLFDSDRLSLAASLSATSVVPSGFALPEEVVVSSPADEGTGRCQASM